MDGSPTEYQGYYRFVKESHLGTNHAFRLDCEIFDAATAERSSENSD